MGASSSNFYNRIAFAYPLVDFFLRTHKKLSIDTVNAEPAGHVLEIGVGNGSHLSLYRNHWITAIDNSESMLNRAARFRGDKIQFLAMDGESLSFPSSSYNYVVMCHVLAVVNDHAALLREVLRVLKPGGRLYILNHFTPDNWMGKVDSVFQPLSSLLHFKSKFRVEDVEGLQHFRLVRSSSMGVGSYFKLIIFEKP